MNIRDTIRVPGTNTQFDVDVEFNVDKGEGTYEDMHNVDVHIVLKSRVANKFVNDEDFLQKAAKAVFSYCFSINNSDAMDNIIDDDLYGGSTEVAVSLVVPNSSPLVPFLKKFTTWWDPSEEEEHTLFIGFWSYDDSTWSD